MNRFFCSLFLLTFSHFSNSQSPINTNSITSEFYYSSIPFNDSSGLLIIPVTINGKTYRFLFDTGAFTAISPALDSVLDLKKSGSSIIHDGNNLKGRATHMLLKEITLGTITFRNTKIAVFSSPLFNCLKIDGFLGNDLLRESYVKIEPVLKQIIITNQKEKLALEQKGRYATEMTLNNQFSPFIDIPIKNKATATFITQFDTGFRGFYQMSNAQASQEKLRPCFLVKDSGLIKGSGSLSIYHKNIEELRMVYRLQIPELKISNTVFNNVSIESSDHWANLVGVELLKYGTCILDNINKKFYFIPVNEHPWRPNLERWPISLGLSDDDLIITYVWNSKLNNSLHIGDLILAIDDRKFTNDNFCSLVNQSPFGTGTVATLTIKDQQGAIKKVSIQKR